jgi:hypothetical protein
LSRAKAIDAFCKSCIHDPSEAGNWRQQVQACEISSCALYDYRPKSNARSETRPKRAISDAKCSTLGSSLGSDICSKKTPVTVA